MEIKPIKSDRDYRRVLKEIDALMDARANTAAGDRLDVLTTLPMIRKLHNGLRIPAEVLIGEARGHNGR